MCRDPLDYGAAEIGIDPVTKGETSSICSDLGIGDTGQCQNHED